MLCECKCTEKQILADIYFSTLCLNCQYRQDSVTTKYECFTVMKSDSFVSYNFLIILLVSSPFSAKAVKIIYIITATERNILLFSPMMIAV